MRASCASGSEQECRLPFSETQIIPITCHPAIVSDLGGRRRRKRRRTSASFHRSADILPEDTMTAVQIRTCLFFRSQPHFSFSRETEREKWFGVLSLGRARDEAALSRWTSVASVAATEPHVGRDFSTFISIPLGAQEPLSSHPLAKACCVIVLRARRRLDLGEV